jgi:glutamate synthase (NADPH/NADH) large chain
MPKETAWRKVIQSIIADQIKDEALTLLGWRDVPTDNSSLGETVKPTEPAHMQVFIGRNGTAKNEDEFERRLYILRKSISQAIYQRRDRGLAGYYPVSLSCRTVDLQGHVPRRPARQVLSRSARADFESALALVHQRFSTNTFPTWSLAHPYRMIAHNGEINTLRGNVNWMAARRPRCIPSSTARTSAGCGRSPMKARATPPASTTRSNSWCRAATRCRTPS